VVPIGLAQSLTSVASQTEFEVASIKPNKDKAATRYTRPHLSPESGAEFPRRSVQHQERASRHADWRTTSRNIKWSGCRHGETPMATTSLQKRRRTPLSSRCDGCRNHCLPNSSNSRYTAKRGSPRSMNRWWQKVVSELRQTRMEVALRSTRMLGPHCPDPDSLLPIYAVQSEGKPLVLHLIKWIALKPLACQCRQ